MSSVKEHWNHLLIRDLKDSELIAEKNPFREWELNTMPESSGERLLKYALEIMYADVVHPLGTKFLDQCVMVCERATKEQKFTDERCKGGFPRNRGLLNRVFAYALALRGNFLDTALLIGGARDISAWYSIYSKGEWNQPQAQAVYLGAVRMALVSGDFALASELLSVKRKFKHHPAEFDLLQKLTVVGPEMGQREDLFAEVETFFNTIRNPSYDSGLYFERDIAAFEWGAIREKYFVSGDSIINWSRVIEAVSI